MALFHYRRGVAPARGHLVETLQRALGARGHDPNGVDGIFGPGVARALKSWRGRDDDGPLTVAEWEDLTALPAPTPFDLCIQLTASFEGHGFTKVAGNWDGAYLTWGLIGFTLKHSLAEVLLDIDAAAGDQAQAIFGDARYDALLGACRGGAEERKALGDEISMPPNKYAVREDWARAFERLGNLAAARRVQLDHARKTYWGIATRDAGRLDARTIDDMGLLFDTAVNNGGINAKKRKLIDQGLAAAPTASGADRRMIWARGIADGSSARFRADVLSRRSVFAEGTGRVHGARYDASMWGFDDAPVDLAEAEAVPPVLPPDDYTDRLRTGRAVAPPAAPTPETAVDRPTVRHGDRGPAVRDAQRALVAAGHDIGVDGIFGPGTESAVTAFQADRGLTVDGVIGPDTWAALS